MPSTRARNGGWACDGVATAIGLDDPLRSVDLGEHGSIFSRVGASSKSGAVHQDTIAFEMAFGSAKGLSRPKRESTSRWVSGPGNFRMDAWSLSIKLSEGSVLTMISVV